MKDNRNVVEREFDASIMKEVEKAKIEGKWISTSSPNGLGEGTGRWSIYHSCSNPKTTHPLTEDGVSAKPVIACQNCGQRFEYKAFASDFEHPDVQWTFEAHMKKKYPPDGIPPWDEEEKERYGGL